MHKNICIEVNSEAPQGSGLGASSAIAVALVTALARWTGRRLSKGEIVEYAKSAETQTIKVPTGYQDYWAAAYRGLKIYRIGLDGRVEYFPIGNPAFLRSIERNILLVYSGKPHFSGVNNWKLFKKYFDGDRKTRNFFGVLAENAVLMEKAMKRGSIKEIAGVMNRDWKVRKSMLPSMTTPSIERLGAMAFRNGARALRVCGAGGGGCIAILVPPKKRNGLAGKIENMGMRVFKPKIVS